MEQQNTAEDRLLAALEAQTATIGVVGLGYVGISMGDTRNSFASRGLPMTSVTKA